MSSGGGGHDILLVEDDHDLAGGLTDALQIEGYRVSWAADGEAGLDKALRGGHDLVILDAMLPGISGFDVLKKLRAHEQRLPILMLTAKGQEVDKVRGLRLGADDYVTKPFGVMELMARVEALLRRAEPTATRLHRLKLKDVLVDFQSRKAWRRGRVLNLTAREFQILEILTAKQGQAVSRTDLVAAIWGGRDSVEVSTRTVDQHVAAIRRKLRVSASSQSPIETVYGYGYRLARRNEKTQA